MAHEEGQKIVPKWHFLSGLLGVYMREDGFLTDAVCWMILTIEVRSRVLGRESCLKAHSDRLGAMECLALIYLQGGREEEGLQMLEESLSPRRTVLPPKHAKCNYRLGRAYLEVGRRQDSCDILERTLRIQEEVLGSEDPDTLNTMHDLVRAREISRRGQVVP